METARYNEKFNVVKHRDASSLLQYAIHRFSNRPIVIAEIGSNSGKTTSEIAKSFPEAKVIGIESDMSLLEYSRVYNCRQTNVVYVYGCIAQAEFWDQITGQLNLAEHSIDLIISTHYFRLSDPAIGTAFNNIDRLLKPNGAFYSTFSLWTDLFEIEKEVAHKILSESIIKIPTADKQLAQAKPNRREDIAKLKQLLKENNFAPCPEIVLVNSQIKIKLLKKIQDAIKCLCQLCTCIPETKRLEFCSQFFEGVYNDYFGPRDSISTFQYDYMVCRCHKVSSGGKSTSSD